ncbi:MAG: ABC transporter ATP-binding protein [Geminicoccaceae bacterium]|nr:ABC transporter ATP-binding protein [Geminicoccaceae bacterium]
MKLVARNLRGGYGQAAVLFGLDLEFAQSEVVALLGRNGAGKSSTLRALIGLLPRRSGSIRLDGQDIARLPPYAIARLGLGYVPEDRRVFQGLTVEENLAVGRRIPRPGAPAWTPDRLYALFPNLRPLRRRRGGQMSGGEQQMLAIARTLMGNPALLLLDEPAEGLAPLVVDALADTIQTLKAEGLGILLSEQNPRFARRVADRAYVLERGEIRFAGAIDGQGTGLGI